MLNRRGFVQNMLGAVAIARPALRDDGFARIFSATHGVGARSPEEIATDEDFWFAVQQAFTVDRSIVNLNNGGVSPSPKVVQDAMVRALAYSADGRTLAAGLRYQPGLRLWETAELVPK